MVTAALKMHAASWPCQPRPSEQMCLKAIYVLEKRAAFSLVLPKVTWESMAKWVFILTATAPTLGCAALCPRQAGCLAWWGFDPGCGDRVWWGRCKHEPLGRMVGGHRPASLKRLPRDFLRPLAVTAGTALKKVTARESRSVHKPHSFLGEGPFGCADVQRDTSAGCYLLFENFAGVCGGAEPPAASPLLCHSGELLIFGLLLLGELWPSSSGRRAGGTWAARQWCRN